MFKPLWITLALLQILSGVSTAEAAVRFSLRGDSLTPRYALGGKKNTAFIAPATAASPPVVSSLGHASVFGGQAINFQLLGDTRGQIYRLGESWINASNVFSLRIRIVPDWTGVPPFANRVVKTFSPTASGDAAGGFYMEIEDTGKLRFHGRYNTDAGGNIITFLTAAPLSFTSGTATDIMVVGNGTNYYASQDGVEIATGAYTDATKNFDNVIAGNMLVCPYPCDFWVNELTIWDTAEAHTYAARTDFLTVADFDGTSNSDPGVANVNVGTAYTIAGSALTGTKTTPSVGDVKTGVTFGASLGLTGTYDGSDRWTAPSAGDLRSGIQLKNNSTSLNLTGTLTAPSLANTKTGVAGDGGTGTYDGSDRWSCPVADNLRLGASDLKCNSASTNLVGTLVVPSLANTKVGVAGDGGTGTYDGTDRHTHPTAGQVLYGIQFKNNSTSNNVTGTLEQVTKVITRATLGLGSGSAIQQVITQGDAVTLQFTANAAPGVPHDLTGATFETKITGSDGAADTFVTGAHAIQDATSGEFSLTLTAAETAALKPGLREVVTKITQSGLVMHFRSFCLTIRSTLPES